MTVEIAARLYRDVVSPLVLGGTLRPGRAIGGAAALTLFESASAVDDDLRSRTDLGRARVARKWVTIDVLPEASRDDWALFAAAHDWLAAASPELASVLAPRASDRLVAMVESVLEHVKPPRHTRDALSRHTFFARLFEIERKDVRVSFWAGSRVYLGTKPPERLMLWPELRKVRTTIEARPLVSLPEFGGHVDKDRWMAACIGLLRRTPLTDLATLARDAPQFEWSAETLGLVATRAGRTLAARILRAENETAVLTSLGRATRALVERGSFRSASVAAELLCELALSLALGTTPGEWSRLAAEADRSRDLFFGLAFGAMAASARKDPILALHDAATVRARLAPIAESEDAQRLLGR